MSVSLAAVQKAGFPMGGEPLAALDLVDTLMTAATPARDLIEDDAQARRWWEVQEVRLPAGPRPPATVARRLRAALREVFDAHLEQRLPDPDAVADVNAFAAAVPSSDQLVVDAAGARSRTRWHTEHGGNAMLSAIAREAIALMADPERRALLRRCASPACSMLFLAENKKRVWCSSAICGNRARAARHYRRTRGWDGGGSR